MGRRATVMLVLVGLSAGTLSGATLATFTSSRSNLNNSFAAASSFGIEFVKHIGAAACGGASTAITVPAGGVAAGNTLLLRVSIHNVSTGTISATDSRSNTYTLDADGVFPTKGRMAIVSANVGTALQSGDTITVTHPDSKSEAVVIDEFSGIASSGRVDATGTGGDKSTTPSATATTTTANTLLLGGVWHRNNPAFTQATGWSDLTFQGTDPGCEMSRNRGGYRIVSSTGTYSYNPTIGGAEEWAAAVVAYKAA